VLRATATTDTAVILAEARAPLADEHPVMVAADRVFTAGTSEAIDLAPERHR
jgi:hypothetical protein